MLLNQIQHSSEMPDAVSSGKIEVVVTVIAIVFTVLVIYLISIDRRLRKQEKK